MVEDIHALEMVHRPISNTFVLPLTEFIIKKYEFAMRQSNNKIHIDDRKTLRNMLR